MSTHFYPHDDRGTASPSELASRYTRGKRARDSIKEGDNGTSVLAKRVRSIGCVLNGNDSLEHQIVTELSCEDYNVGWVCALPSEMAAAKAMLDVVHTPLPMNPNDTNNYVFGSIGHHNIVVACLPSGQCGITRAAIVANNMRWSFPSIRIRLMVGIGGGVPNKVDMRLGDVVVSSPTPSSPGVIQYDFGKTVNAGQFQITGSLNKPPQDLLGAVAKLQADHESRASSIPLILSEMIRRNPNMAAYTFRGTEQDRLYAANYDHLGGTCDGCDTSRLVHRPARLDNNPRIHYGTIASANQVMKHGLTRDRLAQEHNILCFEMEAAGLMDHFPCLVVRGICDYSDSHKAKQWQEYAAATAAAYSKELLSVIPVQKTQYSPSKPDITIASSTSPAERRQMLLDSLRFEQIDSRHASIKAAHAKTCHWLLEHSDYLDWLDPNKTAHHHGFLWISGKPGTGKSTIMKFAFSKATKDVTPESAVISFFFNARGGVLEKGTEGMYRSLLLQLLEKLPMLQVVLDDVAASFSYNSPGQLNISLIQDLMLKAVAKLGRQEVTFFVDALDECDEEGVREMLEFFVDLGHCAVQRNTKLLICFSSRHYPYIDIPHCQRFTLEDQMGHEEDIKVYVQNKLQTGNKKQSEEIKTQILQKASGVFMWVVLVVDILNKEYKRGRIFAVKERLSEIPPKLSDLFRDILTRDKENMDDLLLCIQWLLFGSRPLKREEYYFAMTAGLRPETPVPWDPDEITNESMNLFVLSSSKGLAETSTKSKKSIVQFIHESVRDFLLKDGGLESLWPNLGNDFLGKSHERLKQCCYTYVKADLSAYLAEDDSLLKASTEHVASLRQKVTEKHPFMAYAATQLLHHSEAAASTIKQGRFLQDFVVSMYRFWISRRNLFSSKLSRRRATASLLSFFVEQHYMSLIKTTISSVPLFLNPILVSNDNNDNALVKAIQTESEREAKAILQSLLRYRDSRGGTSPSDSKTARQVELIINQPDKKQRTPLSYAAEKGLTEIVRLLLEFDVNNGQNDIVMTLLSLAVQKGHIDVVKLLVCPEPSIFYHDASLQLQPSLVTTTDRSSGDLSSSRSNTETTPLSTRADASNTLYDMRVSGAAITVAFWEAVRYQRDDIAVFLLEKGAETNPSSRTVDHKPAIHAAIQAGLETLAESLLENAENVNTVNNDGLTPLLFACRNSKLTERIAKVLVSKGASVQACDKDWKTPLHLACDNRGGQSSSAVAEVLIAAGADVKALDSDGNSPLHVACRYGDQATVELLVQEGADIKALNSQGSLPLHFACRAGNQAIVDFFLSRGVDFQIPDKDGKTPLHLACQFQNTQTAELLLKKGAKVTLLDNYGKSPLHFACQSDKPTLSKMRDSHRRTFEPVYHDLTNYGIQTDPKAHVHDVPEIVDLLLNNGAQLDCEDNIGETPLFYAVRWSTGPTFNYLLSIGADVSVTDTWDQTLFFALPIAGYHSEWYLADKGIQLLQKGLDPMQRDDMGQTFLHIACQSGVVSGRYLHFVREAVKFGLDVDVRDNAGRTPVMNAAKFGNQAFVSLLLELGVNPNQMDHDCRTPLTEAIRSSGASTVVADLLEKGANPHPSPETKYIPLFVAVETGLTTTARLLLNHGVKIGVTDAIGRSPMFFLSQDFPIAHQMAKYLLEKGADINHRDATGQNILHYAAKRTGDSSLEGMMMLCKVLIQQHHLEVNAQDQTGKTPLLYAVSYGNYSTMRRLLEFGANPNISDTRGQTPLCERIAGKIVGMLLDVRLLLNYGGAVEARGLDSETPLALAMRLGDRELIELLQS